MTNTIPNHLLSQLSKLIAFRMGLHFSETKWSDLMRGINAAAAEFGFTNTEKFVTWLISFPLTKNHVERLASHLTIGETYFFREKGSFNVLEEQILPDLIRSRQESEKRVRIWSAGCSTGEEPYSIAILLSKMIVDFKDWNITILATDINPNSLKKAAEGVYTEWSFRDTQSWVKEKYFKRTADGRYEICPNIKRMVLFEYLNLAEDIYPSLLNNTNAMDIIFCRNVLMYFSPELAKKVVRGFYNSLVDHGMLSISPTEAVKSLYPQFVTANFPGTAIYRKPRTEETLRAENTEKIMNRWEKGNNVEREAGIADFTVLQLSDTVSLIPDTQIIPVSDSAKSGETEERKTTERQQTPHEEAFAMYGQGRYADVEKKLAELLLHDQHDPKVLTLLVRACANQGRFDEALTWCKKAVAADKFNPSNHYLLATILQEKGQFEEAIAALKRALYFDPNFVLAYFVLGNLMQRQGDSKSSVKYLDNAFELSSAYEPEEILPESEGITAGRLMEIITSTVHG